MDRESIPGVTRMILSISLRDSSLKSDLIGVDVQANTKRLNRSAISSPVHKKCLGLDEVNIRIFRRYSTVKKNIWRIMQSVILCVALLINSYYSILFSSNATHKSHRLFKKSMRFLSSVQSGYSVLSFIGKASSRINLLAFTSKRAYISVVLTDTCPSQSRMIIML